MHDGPRQRARRTAGAWAAATFAAALCVADCRAEAVQANLGVTDVRVVVHWSTPAEIRAARARHGGRGYSSREIRRGQLETAGLAVLKRIGDAYVCELWVPRPKGVDDAATLTVGHELLHCLLGAYH